MNSADAPAENYSQRTLLSTLGWIALSVAIGSTVYHPPEHYELSIYIETPLVFWGLAILAGATGIWLLLMGKPRRPVVEFSLLPAVVLTIVSLPIIRRYYFYGYEDPMSHLGWTKDLLAGGFPEDLLLYPVIHHLAAVLSRVAGVEPRLTLMIVVVSAIIVWLISIPLLVRHLIPQSDSYRYGITLACLLLPINPFNVFVRTHPTSQAIHFSPLIILAMYLLWRGDIPAWSGTGLFIVLAGALSLFHPMVSLGIAGVFFIAGGVGWLYHYRTTREALLPILGAVLLVGLTLAVIYRHPRVLFAIEINIARLLSANAGSDVASRASSLDILGVSLASFIARIGGKYILVIPFGAAGLIAWYRNEASRFVGLLGIAMFPLAGAILLFLAAGVSNFWGRFVGLAMVPGTIIIGVGLAWLHQRSGVVGRGLATGVLAVALALSMATILTSPFVLLPSHHVTESSIDSSETYFQHAELDDVDYRYVRTSPHRYVHGSLGDEEGPLQGGGLSTQRVPDHFNNQSLGTLDNQSHLFVVDGDSDREIELYDGFRYNESDFAYLESTEDANLVFDGGIEIYVIQVESG